MPTMTINGAEIAYAECGRGEPVVLVHSTASSGAQWRKLCEHLGRDFRLVAPDLHGYGESAPWHGRAPMTLADEAAIVSELIASFDGPVHLVGHSFGGAVALRAALEHPERIRTLTLIEPAAFYLLRDGDAASRGLFPEIDAVARAVAGALVDGDYHRGMARFVDYWNGEGAWERTREEKREALVARAGKVALDFAAIAAERTPLETYAALRMPTLVLRGERSPATTRRITELLASTLPGAALETIPEAGHMLPVTHAEPVNAAIADHLLDHAVPAEPRRAA